jgi:CheY-like chemotaxis protein
VVQTSKYHVLVVDDEPGVRKTVGMILAAAGYEVSTAKNGFDALLQLKRTGADLIISDLNMPQMSGFELLSVVRRRFPDIVVIASSGAYASGEHIPGGIIADAFYAKGRQTPEELLALVAHLMEKSATRARDHRQESAPVWIPRNGKDSKGIPFIVLTCTECLRSFPVSVLREDIQEIQEIACLFCENPVRYVIDFSIAVASPKPPQRDLLSGVGRNDDSTALRTVGRLQGPTGGESPASGVSARSPKDDMSRLSRQAEYANPHHESE